MSRRGPPGQAQERWPRRSVHSAMAPVQPLNGSVCTCAHRRTLRGLICAHSGEKIRI